MNLTTLSRAGIEAALGACLDPYLNIDPVRADCLREIAIQGDQVWVRLELPYPAEQFKHEWAQTLEAALQKLPSVRQAEVQVDWAVATSPRLGEQTPALAQVKNLIAVASGKGGVGKSTTAANLALALAREGARVGMLDADIYGPSQGILFGIADGAHPQINGQRLQPLQAYGVQLMSMAFLSDQRTPLAWRGPMASGALLQLITQTDWGDLDYLIVDMPPGTGDIQLTLAQKTPVAGSLIVTTPQDLALLDAQKGIEMFHKVNIPVLGIVENMAVHICSNCGHVEHLFGEGGGEKLAEQYGVGVLASLPLAMSIRTQADAGKPTVIADPDSPIARLYQQLARRAGARIAQQQHLAATMPSIEITDD